MVAPSGPRIGWGNMFWFSLHNILFEFSLAYGAVGLDPGALAEDVPAGAARTDAARQAMVRTETASFIAGIVLL
jgi:hypothetical protein